MTFPDCFITQVYPVSPALHGQGTKWPFYVVALQRYLLTFFCLGKVQNNLPRLFHYAGISRKPCCARARYKVTDPDCCIEKIPLTFLCLGNTWMAFPDCFIAQDIPQALFCPGKVQSDLSTLLHCNDTLWPFFAWERYRMSFPDCFMAQVYPVSPALPGQGTKWPSQTVSLHRYKQ